MDDIRIGYGFDTHRWQKGRKLILGGIEIPHDKGLLGHSDADALIHAIIDALFGALCLGDIGRHFPDTDPKYKDVDSKVLLKDAVTIIYDKGFTIGNIDSTVVADEPKMAPHIPKMRKTLAPIVGIAEDRISIKATRTEGVVFQGNGGIVVMAAVLLMNRISAVHQQ